MSLEQDAKDAILRSISLEGAASEENKTFNLVLGSRSHLNHILDKSSGMPRLRANVIKRFEMIISQPTQLQALNSFEIRCVLCKSVISYPAWYYKLAYSVNHFHFFICFDRLSSDKPSARCYKRDIK